MPTLLPCRDSVQAHLLRSWLAEHGIDARVEHEFGGTLYAGAVANPSVVIEDADREEAARLAQTFTPPSEEELAAAAEADAPSAPPALPEPQRGGPGLLETMFWLMLIFGIWHFAGTILFRAMGFERGTYDPEAHAAQRLRDFYELLRVLRTAAIGGVVAWLLIHLARAARDPASGRVGLLGRFIALFVLLFGTDFLGVFTWLASWITWLYEALGGKPGAVEAAASARALALPS